MVKEVLLVRHGMTKWNQQGIVQGSKDIHLSLEGIDQIESLARDFKEQQVIFDGIIVSPLRRARQTAEMLGLVFNVPVTIHPGLSERNMGEFEGRLISDLKVMYGDQWEHLTPSGGESVEEFNLRTVSAFSQSMVKYEGERPLIVGHGFSIAKILGHFDASQNITDSYGIKNATLYSLSLPEVLPTEFGIPTSK